MSVFVGRERELERLRAALRNAQAGQGRLVFITGEPGAGKSSLVSQFMVESALDFPDTRIIGATCSEQYGAAEPYQPFVEAFRSMLADGPRTGGRWSSLKELATEVAPHWINAIPVVGGIITAGLTTAAELRHLHGGVATAAPSEEALFFQYTELFFAAAARHPIVLFIDDLHWADSASVSLLTHLARRIEREHVLILGTYRPADVDVTQHPLRKARLELERYGVAEELALAALDSAANAELIREELGAPATPELLEWLELHAGSNALFFVELLKWVVEQGLVRRHHDEYTLVSLPESIEIPRSAEATIESRLGRLDPETYKILEYASVEGNEFGSTTLAQLMGMDELELEEVMEALVRLHRLVRFVDTRDLPSGELSSIYQFSHSLIQDVLHRNLQGKRRILLHRKMAEIVEQVYALDTDSVAHKLAIHFDEGRLPARAFEFAMRGAERARRLYAHRDAVELTRRALRNAQEPDQKCKALDLLGETNHVIGHFPDALAAFNEAVDLARTIGDSKREISVRRKLITVERDHGGSPPERIESQLNELAERARAVEGEAELCNIIWLLNSLPGTLDTVAIERATEALRICELHGDPRRIAKAQYNLGRTLAFGANPAEATPHFTAALEIYTRIDDRFQVGECHNMLGAVQMFRGDYRAAATYFQAAEEAFDEVGDPVHGAGVRSNLGMLLTRLGEWEAAENKLRQSIRLNLRLDAGATLLYPLENLGDLYQTAGKWPEADAQWRVLLERALDTGYWDSEVTARCGIGIAAIERGDLDAAHREELAARDILTHHEGWSEARAAYHHLSARLAAARADADRALHLLESAEQELAARDRYTWATFRLLRGEIIARTSRATAVPLIQEALTVFEELGSEPMRQRGWTLLANIAGDA